MSRQISGDVEKLALAELKRQNPDAKAEMVVRVADWLRHRRFGMTDSELGNFQTALNGRSMVEVVCLQHSGATRVWARLKVLDYNGVLGALPNASAAKLDDRVGVLDEACHRKEALIVVLERERFFVDFDGPQPQVITIAEAANRLKEGLSRYRRMHAKLDDVRPPTGAVGANAPHYEALIRDAAAKTRAFNTDIKGDEGEGK